MTENLLLGIGVGVNVAENVFVMFLLMGIGYVLAKKKILTDAGTKQLTEILLLTVVPCVIINAYQRDFDADMAKKLCVALLFSVIVHIIAIILCPVIFSKSGTAKKSINIFGAVYGNCGFMALPIIQSLYGNDGVFYAVAFVTVFNILYWTHGVFIYTNDLKQISIKSLLKTPGIIGTVIGVLLFFMHIRLPEPVLKTVSFMASLNTPIPMIILGTYLVGFDFKVIKNISMWGVCIFRLIAFPVIGIAVAYFLNMENAVSIPLIISCGCPVATVTSLFAVRYGLDSGYASQIVSFSTILSIITIPITMVFATVILG